MHLIFYYCRHSVFDIWYGLGNKQRIYKGNIILILHRKMCIRQEGMYALMKSVKSRSDWEAISTKGEISTILPDIMSGPKK